MFLRNVGWISTDYTALYPRRYNCFLERSWKYLWLITWILEIYGHFSMSQVCLLHLAFRVLITLASSNDWLSLYRRLLFLSLVMATVAVEPRTFWTLGYALDYDIPFRLSSIFICKTVWVSSCSLSSCIKLFHRVTPCHWFRGPIRLFKQFFAVNSRILGI
jgi:hypothetical protein